MNKKWDSRSYWNDFRERLTSDYCFLSKQMDPICVFIGPMNSSADDYSLSLGGKKVMLSELGNKADSLYEGVQKGERPYVAFVFKDGTPTVLLVNKNENVAPTADNLLGFVTAEFDKEFQSSEDIPEGMRLPPVLIDEVLKFSSEHEHEFLSAIESEAKCCIDKFYHDIHMIRKDEMVNKSTFYFISEDSPLKGNMVYQNLFLMDRNEIDDIKNTILSVLTAFYAEEFESGEIETKHDVDSSIAYAKSLIDQSFSDENLARGRFEYRISNLGEAKGEVQSDDIARVAVWADMDPAMTPFRGETLDRWVADACEFYGVKKEIVDRKRQVIGGTIQKKAMKPAVSEAVIAHAAKKFNKGLSL